MRTDVQRFIFIALNSIHLKQLCCRRSNERGHKWRVSLETLALVSAKFTCIWWYLCVCVFVCQRKNMLECSGRGVVFFRCIYEEKYVLAMRVWRADSCLALQAITQIYLNFFLQSIFLLLLFLYENASFTFIDAVFTFFRKYTHTCTYVMCRWYISTYILIQCPVSQNYALVITN